MSSSIEIIPNTPLRIRMQQLFKESQGPMLSWSETIPWSDFRPSLELVNLKKWSVFGDYFDQHNIDSKIRADIMSAHFRATLAQFFYGEGAAVQILKQAIELTSDTYIQKLCQRQLDEEQKHHDILLQFFNHTGRGIPEVNPYFNSALETIFSGDNVVLKIIGLQGLLEPAAVCFLRSAIEAGLSQPLEYILKNILADEERHIAFGMLCIKESHGQLKSVKQHVCEEFALSVCKNMMGYACNEINLSHFLKPEEALKFNEYLLHAPNMVTRRKNFFSRSVLALSQMNLLSANMIHHLRKMEFM